MARAAGRLATPALGATLARGQLIEPSSGGPDWARVGRPHTQTDCMDRRVSVWGALKGPAAKMMAALSTISIPPSAPAQTTCRRGAPLARRSFGKAPS